MRWTNTSKYARFNIFFNKIPKLDVVFDITKLHLLVSPHLEGQWITIHPCTFLERILKMHFKLSEKQEEGNMIGNED